MLLKILSKIPYIQCLLFFPWSSHKIALKKLGALWALTNLPLLLTAMLTKVESSGTVFDAVLQKLSASISPSEQFIYIISILTPILYLLFEKYESLPKPDSPGQNRVAVIFKGYGLVALSCLLLIILTAFAFGSIKTNTQEFEGTLLYLMLAKGAIPLYLFAIYCWYLSLLDETTTAEKDYVENSRKLEQKVATGLAARLRARGDN